MLPATEVGMCRFVSRLAADKLKHKKIKAYLSGVRYLHIAEGRRDPFEGTMNRLQYTLRGIKRCEAESGDKETANNPRLPQEDKGYVTRSAKTRRNAVKLIIRYDHFLSLY